MLLISLISFKTFQVYSSWGNIYAGIAISNSFKTFQVYSSCYRTIWNCNTCIWVSKLFKFIVHWRKVIYDSNNGSVSKLFKFIVHAIWDGVVKALDKCFKTFQVYSSSNINISFYAFSLVSKLFKFIVHYEKDMWKNVR